MIACPRVDERALPAVVFDPSSVEGAYEIIAGLVPDVLVRLRLLEFVIGRHGVLGLIEKEPCGALVTGLRRIVHPTYVRGERDPCDEDAKNAGDRNMQSDQL